MMKCVVLFLLLVSVVSASFWAKDNPDPNIIIREGHRSVVVEYDENGEEGNTKIFITPQHPSSSENCNEERNIRRGPKELVCDTVGKCKHKIAEILEKIEEKSKEGASKGAGKVKETLAETKEGASKGVDKVEDTIGRAKEGAEQTWGETKESASEGAEKVGDALGRAKDGASKGAEKVGDALGQAKEGASEGAEKVGDTLGRAKEGASKGAEKVGDALGRAKEGASKGVDKVEQTWGETKEGAKWTWGETKEGASKGAEKVQDAFGRAKEGASKGVHKVKEAVGETKEDAKQTLGETKESASEGVDRAKEALGETKDGAIKNADKVKGALGKGGGRMKDTIENVKESDLVDTLKRALADMEDNLSGKMGKSKEAEEEGIGKIKDVFHKLEEIDVLDTPKRVTEDVGRVPLKRVKQFAHTFMNWNQMDSVIAVVHLLGFTMAFGMSMWITFVSSYILGDALPRHQFGMVQSKLYPVYFKMQAFCIGVVLVTHLLSNWRRVFSSGVEVLYGASLITSLVMSLSNLLYWEPQATTIMFKRLKLEKEEGEKEEGRGKVSSEPVSRTTNNRVDSASAATTAREKELESKTNAMLSEQLQSLNRISSYANVATIMSLSLHMVYLGQRIKVSS